MHCTQGSVDGLVRFVVIARRNWPGGKRTDCNISWLQHATACQSLAQMGLILEGHQQLQDNKLCSLP